MTKGAENLARSITDRLVLLAAKQQVPYNDLLMVFLIERMAHRLAANELLADVLVFKGGFVGLRVYDSHRFTVDLDALLLKGDLTKIQQVTRDAVEAEYRDGVWFRFERESAVEGLGEYPGIRLVFRAGLGAPPTTTKKARIVNLDIAVGDKVSPVREDTPFLLGDGELSWFIYPLEAIVAEKLHTLYVRGSANSRAKDLLDLHFFLRRCDRSELKKALNDTFVARQTEFPASLANELSKLDRTTLRLAWRSAQEVTSENYDFEECFEDVVNSLRELI